MTAVAYQGRHARPTVRQTRAASVSPAQRRTASLRHWQLFMATVIIIPVTTAAVMIEQHGFAFFAFRSQGTGFTGDGALTENQGPGQPDAPKPALIVAVLPDGTRLNVPPHDTWAGVAELRNGKWAILSAGTSQAQVTARTAKTWAAHPSLYKSGWIAVPVTKVAS